ncbi:MAG: phytoene desaturase family protein [Actinomycetota bacterium]
MAVHDVAVIGGGHNGLVAALVLAREGADVVVLEANSEPGGCIWTQALPTGHRLERGAIDHSQILDVARELRLEEHGLRYRTRSTAVGAAFGDGTTLTFPVDRAELEHALDPTGDLDGYLHLARLGSLLFDLLDDFGVPPTLTALAAALRSLPQGDELMRLMVSSADSVLRRHLTDAHLISALSMHASHSQVPSFMPGTGSFALLLPASAGTSPARPEGGSAALIEALVRALEAAGGKLMVDSAVEGIEDLGRCRRIRLAGGSTVDAGRVVSTIDVRRTTGLVDAPPPSLRDIAGDTHDGSLNVGELKVDVALDARVPLGPLEAAPGALWMVQSDVDALHRSYGDVLAGRVPTGTAFMWASPSETDPAAAPPGGSVMWMSAFVPLRPATGEWTHGMEEDAAQRILEGFAAMTGTDLRSRAVEVAITGPVGWARRLGSATGNPNHLDLTLDQLLGWRPRGAGAHRSPLWWLYLSGAGTHPGGGLSGLPGKNAAAAVLEDLHGGRRRRSRGGRVASLRAGLELYRTMRR